MNISAVSSQATFFDVMSSCDGVLYEVKMGIMTDGMLPLHPNPNPKNKDKH